jgi:hypothetical protein
MKNAICLITYDANSKTQFLDFLNFFSKYDIYVILDDNTADCSLLREKYDKINFIQIDNKECIENGFKNISFITLKKPVTGWDKAVYYFTKKNIQYENVWFFEDDVYFYSENTILQIDTKYKSEDILCNSSYEEGKLHEWLWRLIEIKFSPPYYCGMMCALRLSRKYFTCIEKYIKKNSTMFFLEAFFPTIARKYNVKTIESPIEFLTITHRTEQNNFNKDSLYHPLKNLNDHIIIRESM